jgi:hypothetical protein
VQRLAQFLQRFFRQEQEGLGSHQLQIALVIDVLEEIGFLLSRPTNRSTNWRFLSVLPLSTTATMLSQINSRLNSRKSRWYLTSAETR